MNSQDFLTLNLVGAGAFVFWYLLSRGGSRQPTQLNMKAPDTAPIILEPLTEQRPPVNPGAAALPSVSHHPGEATAKSLNVMFNYNGHCWDAHEVLGVPAGASLKIVTEAYQASLKRCHSPESIEFLETAYKAILQGFDRL